MAGTVEGPLVKHLREIAEGKRPVPTTKARRHHFVPSFALSKFATPQKRDGVLFRLDTNSGQPKKTTPDKSCFVEELYSQENETGMQDRVLEAFFSIVENYAAQAFERFLADPMKLSDADRQTLAYYLAFQYQRTPVVLEHSAQTQQAMMAVVMGLQFAHAESFREKHREIFKDDDSTDEEIEELRQKTLKMLKSGEIAFDKPEFGAFQMMMATVDNVASSMASLTWLLLEAKEDEFVTCDRALAMHDPTPKFPWSGHALRSSPKAQTSYPLAPRHCLVLVQHPQPVAVVEADAEDVREFNLRTYGWASQYIYGTSQEVVQRVRIQAKDKPALVIRPRGRRRPSFLRRSIRTTPRPARSTPRRAGRARWQSPTTTATSGSPPTSSSIPRTRSRSLRRSAPRRRPSAPSPSSGRGRLPPTPRTSTPRTSTPTKATPPSIGSVGQEVASGAC